LARRLALGVRGEARQVRVPAVRQLALLHADEAVRQLRVLLAVFREPGEPGFAQFLAASADAVAEVLVYAVGNEKLRILGPAVEPLGGPDLVRAERLAVGGAGVLLVWGAPGDVTLHDDQRRPVVRLSAEQERAVQLCQIVRITDSLHGPTVAEEARY